MNTKISPKIKLLILLIIVAIGLAFFGFVKLGSSSSTISLYVTSILIIIAGCFFTSDTVKLLYKFYEQKAPWQRSIPVINEFYAIDIKLKVVAYIFFIIGVILTVIGFLPYSVKSIFGATFATEGSFYTLFGAFIIFSIMQIIVGIGTVLAIRDIKNEWATLIGTDIGMIKILGAFALFPILRILSYYAMRKPLDTLVAFNNLNASSANAASIILDEDEEEDEEEFYYEEDEEEF